MRTKNKKESCKNCFLPKAHEKDCVLFTPLSKSSSWEERLEAILDDNFPKLNADNPEIPSSNNRSAALVMFAYTKMLIQNLLASERADEREKVLNEVLESLPEMKEFSETVPPLNSTGGVTMWKYTFERVGFNLALSEVKQKVADWLNKEEN